MTASQNLELFYRPTCPFCQKVLRFMNAEGIELTLRDISADTSAAEELVRVGGKQQVPCLFIDGAPLYESGDIIDWLGAHKA